VVEPLVVHSEGVELEAEVASPPSTPRAAAVLCHPHPQYGGSMRSIVIGALFEALPKVGVTSLRFNFRGVERSTGSFDEGRGEQHDVAAAMAALQARVDGGLPLLLAGWSFGADMALSVRDASITAWIAIAPALHYTGDLSALASDSRPKLLVLAEHDEVRSPAEVQATAKGWAATTTEIVPGASHFFVGRTDRLTEIVLSFVDRLVPSGGAGGA
jgi:uncharacterized protein